MEQETIRVKLDFPLEQVKKPIIWHLAHDYGLMFSIRRASIDFHSGGFTVLELTGPKDRLDAGLAWAQSEGVVVSPIGMDSAEEWGVQ